MNDAAYDPGPASVEERLSKRPRLSSQLAREVGLMRSIPGDKDSGFVGSASGIYFIRSVYASLRRSQTSNPIQAGTPGSEIVPGEDDHLPSIVPDATISLWRSDEIDLGRRGKYSFQELVDWTASYFSNWHPFYPFLHAPTILEYFEQLTQHELSSEDIALDLRVVILRSIISISLADTRQAGKSGIQVPGNLVFRSYDAAVDSLQHVLSKPTSELGIQAAISVQLFLVSMLRLNAASRLGGLINRMAVQLGLHRCPTRYSTFAPDEKNLRRRIFWSLYAIDRFICQSMGLPLGINDDDVDVCFPLLERHLDTQRSLQRQHSDQEPEKHLRKCSFLARQMKMRGDIIELRNKSLQYVQRNPDQATSITAKLTQWWNEIEELSDPAASDALTSYQITILTLLKHESIISLYRPILASNQEGASYDAALQLCIGSARSIIIALHKAMNPILNDREESTQLTLLWPSCTWAVWISTFVLFYAVNQNHLSTDAVARLADRSIDILQHLAKRGSAWPEASAAAIRDLRTRMFNRGSEPSLQDQSASISDAVSKTGLSNPRDTGDRSTYRNQRTSDYGIPLSEQEENGPQNELRTVEEPQRNVDISRSHDIFAGFLGNNASSHTSQNNPMNHNEGFTAWSNLMATSQYPKPAENIPQHQIVDPFSGFDIPFWFDQDQQWDIFQDFN